MPKYTQKWAIVSLLEDLEDGSQFSYTNFPLHVTLAGVFAIDKRGDQLASELSKILKNQRAFEIVADEKDLFGPDKSVAVMKIHSSSDLMSLYNHIYSWLVSENAAYNSPQYESDGYSPHSTFQKSGFLTKGEIRLLRSVSLIDLFPDKDADKRKIFRTIELK